LTSDAVAVAPSVSLTGGRILLAPHSCFACGTLNAHGLQLSLHAAGDRAWADLVVPDRFQGWDGIVHGGILCTILDEVMAWSFVTRDIWAVTARMNVEFRRPVAVEQAIHAEGRVLEVRRRLVLVEGEIRDATDGTLLTRAGGTYVGASAARKAELKSRYGVRLEPAEPAAPDAEQPEPPGVVGAPA
jgi:uncharacterized protein (TIGR00369 family)